MTTENKTPTLHERAYAFAKGQPGCSYLTNGSDRFDGYYKGYLAGHRDQERQISLLKRENELLQGILDYSNFDELSCSLQDFQEYDRLRDELKAFRSDVSPHSNSPHS
jgi:hypothetical protein